MGSQVASDSPYPSHMGKEFAALLILVAGNTCNHVLAIDSHLICSHFFEFVCLLRTGSVL